MINKWFEGVTHISLPTQEYDRGRQEKIEGQTNKQQTWGYQEQRKVCNTICMCRLSLAWVTSENSTMLLESDILRLFFTGPYLVSSPLCSGVWCWLPLRGSTPTSLFASLRSSRNSSLLSNYQLPLLLSNYQLPLLGSSHQLSLLGSCHQLPLSGPCLSLGRVVNSRSPPRTTSGYGEISCPRILCLVSRQNRQLNRLLWQPTHIVLQSISTQFNCQKHFYFKLFKQLCVTIQLSANTV